MAGQAWYRHYALDFLNGVIGMPPDQIGAYIVVLDLIYARGGPIPNDARWLSGNMGCSTRTASALISALVDRGKLQLIDGFLTNLKAEKVLQNDDEKSAKNARNGREGGRKRAENARRANENSALGQAGLKPIREDKRRIEEGREGSAREREETSQPTAPLHTETPPDLGDMQALAQECARAAGTRQIDPAQFGRDIALCREWVAAGAEPELILQTIREGVAASAKPIFSLRFFDQQIRTAIAKKEAQHHGHTARTPNQPDELAQRAAARIAARRAAAGA